jgi:hypothetical protein
VVKYIESLQAKWREAKFELIAEGRECLPSLPAHLTRCSYLCARPT